MSTDTPAPIRAKVYVEIGYTLDPKVADEHGNLPFDNETDPQLFADDGGVTVVFPSDQVRHHRDQGETLDKARAFLQRVYGDGVYVPPPWRVLTVFPDRMASHYSSHRPDPEPPQRAGATV